MESYEIVYEAVKRELSEKRFRHSVGVMERCVDFARANGADVEKARLIGIAHDIAKEIPKEERVRMAVAHGIELDEMEKENTSLIHAKLGAEICRERFGFTDDMCQAIAAHTTAKEYMNDLAKILYLSDYCEPNREFDTTPIYELGKRNLEDGFFAALIGKIKYTLDCHSKLHMDSIKAYNRFLEERQFSITSKNNATINGVRDKNSKADEEVR